MLAPRERRSEGPRRIVDEAKIASLRSQGASWRSISDDLGIGIATLYRASARRSEKPISGPCCNRLIPRNRVRRFPAFRNHLFLRKKGISGVVRLIRTALLILAFAGKNEKSGEFPRMEDSSCRASDPLSLFVTAFTVVFGFLTIATPLFCNQQRRVVVQLQRNRRVRPLRAALFLMHLGNLYGTTVSGGRLWLRHCLPIDTAAGRHVDRERAVQLQRQWYRRVHAPSPSAAWCLMLPENLYGMTASGGTGTGCVKKTLRAPSFS